jgi:hypothetical protein
MSAKKHKKMHRQSGKTVVKPVASRAGRMVAAIPGALKSIPPVQWAKAVVEYLHLPSALLPSRTKHPIQRINE